MNYLNDNGLIKFYTGWKNKYLDKIDEGGPNYGDAALYIKYDSKVVEPAESNCSITENPSSIVSSIAAINSHTITGEGFFGDVYTDSNYETALSLSNLYAGSIFTQTDAIYSELQYLCRVHFESPYEDVAYDLQPVTGVKSVLTYNDNKIFMFTPKDYDNSSSASDNAPPFYIGFAIDDDQAYLSDSIVYLLIDTNSTGYQHYSIKNLPEATNQVDYLDYFRITFSIHPLLNVTTNSYKFNMQYLHNGYGYKTQGTWTSNETVYETYNTNDYTMQVVANDYSSQARYRLGKTARYSISPNKEQTQTISTLDAINDFSGSIITIQNKEIILKEVKHLRLNNSGDYLYIYFIPADEKEENCSFLVEYTHANVGLSTPYEFYIRIYTDETITNDNATEKATAFSQEYLPFNFQLRTATVNSGAITIPFDANYLPPGTMRIFPGMIYHSISPTSPAELFGGTWERIEGKFLLGATDDGSTGTALLKTSSVAAGSSGGEAEHQITVEELASHTHTQNSHSHSIGYRNISDQSGSTSRRHGPYGQSSDNTGNISSAGTTATNQNTGSNTPHNNMPPFLAVYIWKCLEAPSQFVINDNARKVVFLNIDNGAYMPTSVVDLTVNDYERMCQSNTTMGWTNLTFEIVLASAINANTSTKIMNFSSNCIDIIGKTYIFAVGISDNNIIEVHLDSYSTDQVYQGLFITSPVNLAIGDRIKCSFSFPVTH